MRVIAAVVAALALVGAASAGSARTFTLHPGQSKKVGRYTVVCTTGSVARTSTRVVLHVGYQVNLGGNVYKCAKATTPKPTPTPSPSPSPTPTPTPTPPLGSQSNPVPLGKAAAISNGWTVTITQAVPDATSAVLAANMFNDPPQSGWQFFMIYIKATYNGAGSSHLDPGFSMRAVGASAVVRTTFENSCGVLPDPDLKLDDPEVFTGGSVEGWGACWQIPSSDAASLKAFYDPLTDFDGSKRVWFALH